jgi:hypothetical protein
MMSILEGRSKSQESFSPNLGTYTTIAAKINVRTQKALQTSEIAYRENSTDFCALNFVTWRGTVIGAKIVHQIQTLINCRRVCSCTSETTAPSNSSPYSFLSASASFKGLEGFGLNILCSICFSLNLSRCSTRLISRRPRSALCFMPSSASSSTI